tara:strand:+ start:159 stop:554 length:396 start_codon:yes stop_codon:yes gene_type:complete
MKSIKTELEKMITEAEEIIDIGQVRKEKEIAEQRQGVREITASFEQIERYMRGLTNLAAETISKAQQSAHYELYSVVNPGEVPGLERVMRMMEEWSNDEYPRYPETMQEFEECLDYYKTLENQMVDETVLD